MNAGWRRPETVSATAVDREVHAYTDVMDRNNVLAGGLNRRDLQVVTGTAVVRIRRCDCLGCRANTSL